MMLVSGAGVVLAVAVAVWALRRNPPPPTSRWAYYDLEAERLGTMSLDWMVRQSDRPAQERSY
jgi:hypothetical protein